MSLDAGTKLGPYEVVAPLGAGGMGEVYRATDTRLGRDVAVKVLPEALSADPDRLRRFEQEARAAGLLNHPNVLAIHDVGTHDGAPYVVSELLEGQTLRERLGGTGLPARKALDWALQVARGLGAAHEKGIVHRDLKPENIFITSDGRVKILDFGLAKLTRPEASREHTNAPTVTAGTEPGLVLGTVGYMSPEQVRGRPADQRSDIFSFGSILYEMLSGRRAFHGDTAADVMSAILKEEPPELSEVSRTLPAGLERLVHHCLEKSPEERFQSVRDLAYDLEAVSGQTISGARAGPAAAVSRLPRRAPVGLAAAISLAAAAAGLLAGRKIWKAPARPAAEFHQLTFAHGTIGSARFASDGQTVVYSAQWGGAPPQIFLKRPDGPDALPLALPSASVLAVSPAGEMALALDCRGTHNGTCSGTLALAPLTGGSPRPLQENVQQVDWAPDGSKMVLVHDVAGRARLEYPPGKILYETGGHISYPRFSPKGDRIAFLDHPLPSDDRGSVAVIDLAGKKTTLAAGWESEQGLAWSPSANEVWFTAAATGPGRALYAVTLSGELRTVSSVPGSLTLRDISKTGQVLVTHDRPRIGVVALAPGETRERDLAWLEWSILASLSEDGRTVLFDEEGEVAGPNYAVCIRKTDGSPLVRLGEGRALALSPDGQWALARLPKEKAPDVLLPTGPGQPRTLPDFGLERSGNARFSPDGRRILIVAAEPGHGPRLWVEDVEGGKPRPITPEGISFCGPISPDGKLVVSGHRDQNFAIYPVDGGDPRPLPQIKPREELPIRFTSDGRALYVQATRGIPVRIWQLDLASGRKTPWREIAPIDPSGILSITNILVSADGKSYAYSYYRILSDLHTVDGLR
jgi:Tol biopolymer transport system component